MPDDPDDPAVTVSDIDSAPDTSLVSVDDKHVTIDDYRDAFVRVSGEKEALSEELEQTKKRVRTIQILDDLIEPMAKKAFWFMCMYCGAVGVLVTLHGFRTEGFKLPESVLQFLVGSTATTVIGLVGMVLTGIFIGARKTDKE